MNRRGFTAPELTMVMVLIMVAATVVMRGNVVARQRARDASCMSNVKQLGLALQMYAADNNYRLPLQPKAWGAVYPYVRNYDMLRCPQAQHAEESDRTEIGDSDYLLNPTVQADDLPSLIIAGDDVPDRHRWRRWISVRLDGAASTWPAAEWAKKLGEVSPYVKDNE